MLSVKSSRIIYASLVLAFKDTLLVSFTSRQDHIEIIMNNNCNFYSAFFMLKMIKCALQFDKMIENK